MYRVELHQMYETGYSHDRIAEVETVDEAEEIARSKAAELFREHKSGMAQTINDYFDLYKGVHNNDLVCSVIVYNTPFAENDEEVYFASLYIVDTDNSN